MCVPFFILSMIFCLCASEKRLLLTDPDVVQSLQNELHTLRSKVQQLESSQNSAFFGKRGLKIRIDSIKR